MSADGGAVVKPSLGLIFSITLTGILNNTLINPAIPDILTDLDAPSSSAGLLVAAGALPGIVVAPLLGVAADRFGRRPVLLPALVAFGVFGGLSALAPSFEALLVLRLLQGFGSAALLNLAVTLISDHFEGVERARALGRNAAVLTVSIALFPPIGGFLAQLGGWRLSFVPYLAALVTAAVLQRQLPRVARPPRGTTLRLRAALGVTRAPRLAVPIGMGFVAFVLIFGLFLTALPVHLEDRFGMEAGPRGLVLGAPALTSTIIALRLGRLRSRFGARRLLVVAWALFAVAFAVLAGAPTVAVVLAGSAVYGLGEGLLIPTLQDLVAGGAPEHGRGGVISIFGGAVRAGQTVGPLATGPMLGATTTATPFGVGAVTALGVLAVAGAFGRRVGPPVPEYRPGA